MINVVPSPGNGLVEETKGGGERKRGGGKNKIFRTIRITSQKIAGGEGRRNQREKKEGTEGLHTVGVY